jgi:hypothetical protein
LPRSTQTVEEVSSKTSLSCTELVTSHAPRRLVITQTVFKDHPRMHIRARAENSYILLISRGLGAVEQTGLSRQLKAEFAQATGPDGSKIKFKKIFSVHG